MLVICTAHENPIPRNQRAVFSKCFLSEGVQILASSKITANSVMIGPPGTVPNIDCQSFVGKGDEISKADESTLSNEALFFRYHIQTLELLYFLCNGRNRQAIDYFLEKDMVPTYKQILSIMDMNLPPLLKTAYARLLTRLYVDREPYAPLPVIRLSRLWCRIPAKIAVFANVDAFATIPDKKPTPGFSDLKTFCAKYITNLKEPGKNWRVAPLTLEVVQLMELLVSFGLYGRVDKASVGSMDEQYDFEEVKNTVDLFIELLGDEVVAPSIAAKTDIMMCKLAALGLLEIFFNMRVNRRITMALNLAENQFEDFGGDSQGYESAGTAYDSAEEPTSPTSPTSPSGQTLSRSMGEIVPSLFGSNKVFHIDGEQQIEFDSKLEKLREELT